MSGQDVGFFDVGAESPDLVIENGDLKADNGLETSALISLFSNRRVSNEELPFGEKDRMGWWADLIAEVQGDLIGSRHWTLERSKVLQETVVDFENIIREAFDWLLEDGIAKSVEVIASQTETGRIEATVEITKLDGDNIPFKFIWDGQKLKLSE